MDRRILGRWISVFVAVALVGGASQLAWAHAILMESSPAANSTVNGPDLNFNLRFNVRVDGSRSKLRLLAADGSSTSLVIAKQSNPDTLQGTVTALKAGAYKLQWNVLASDGHMSRGEIPFTLK